jgi:hypothetical protein
MQITIPDTNELSELDRNVLAALLGNDVSPASAPASQPKSEPKAESKPKAEKAAPKATKKPELEPEPEPGEEDGDSPDDGLTMKDAVALATKLVSNGEASRVKAALSDLGAKRVSELKSADDIAAFINVLS